MSPRISVIMGVYNCAETLPEALDSIFAQSYQNFKFIICDDGSTDNTYQVVKEYANRYNNIILLKNDENQKLAATLNHCLLYVDTEYVARMDGDDISLPTRFEKEIEFLDSNPEFALVSCAMIHFDENGDWGRGNPKKIPTKNDFRLGNPFAHAPCMIRTSVIKEVNGYSINEKYNRAEDYYLWYKIYKLGHKGYNLSEPLYKMRDDLKALSRRKSKIRLKHALIKLEVLKGLKVKNPYLYTFITVPKVFIPNFLMIWIRKYRMKSTRKET